MPDYEKIYFALTARVADAIELLIKIQQECEEAYISDGGDKEQHD